MKPEEADFVDLDSSRERVLKALNHEEPDRVPLDLGGVSLTSIHKGCYDKLVEYLDLEPNPEYLSWRGHIVRPPQELLESFGTDTRGADLPQSSEIAFGDSFVDDWGVEWKLPRGGDNYIATKSPLQHLRSPSAKDLENFDWPAPEEMLPTSDLSGLRSRAQYLRENEDVAVLAKLPTGIVHSGQFVRGFTQFLGDMIKHPDFVSDLLDRLTELWIEAAKMIVRQVGDLVDVVAWPDDIGTQDNLMFNPSYYRKFIKPRHEAMVAAVKEEADVAVFYHTDGDIFPVLEDIAEIGVDILNPIQTSAKEMEPERVKETVGGKLTLWGGIDTHHVLPHGSPGEVREEVRRKIEVLAPGGGYVLASVHNIQPDVPPENVIAMLEAARRYGEY